MLGAASYHLATATAAYTDTYTGSVSGQNWAMLMAAFKPSVTSGGSSTTLTYTYDENGKRVMLVDPNSTTTRYYSGLYQDTLGGYKKTKNIFVNGALLATFEKTGTATATPYYVLTDPLNSASILMNASGVATQTLDYLPYGDVRVNAKQTSYDSDRKYIGQLYDESTSMSYLNARYYNGVNGQFLSQDPLFRGAPPTALLGSPQGLNFYAYSSNNPINNSDPNGLYQLSGLVEKGDTPDSIAGVLNNAYAAQYGVYFTGPRLTEFNGGKQPVVGSYYSFSIDLGNKYAINGSGYSGGGGYYVGGETNSSSGSVGGGSTPNYYNNSANSVMLSNGGRQDITNSLMSLMRTNADNKSCLNNPSCFYFSFKTGGRWDLKDVPGGPYNSRSHKEGFIFQGKWVPSDAPGNIHYGYVGSGAFWTTPSILRGGAGAYQTISPSVGQTAGIGQDNPGDVDYINQGIQLYQSDQN